MPNVIARYTDKFVDYCGSKKKAKSFVKLLCSEIVAAGLHVERQETDDPDAPIGELTPGAVTVIAKYVSGGLANDLELEVEALEYPRRVENISERGADILAALHTFLFVEELDGPLNVSLFVKLFKGAWLSDTPDPAFDGDMSMDAAIDRVSLGPAA